MSTLTVFKASAGSGKTFTLAVEYIKLLIENPEAFRGILAVTFTNKATEEMKMRILSQLYALSNGLPESEPYLKALQKALPSAKREFIAQQAGKALHLLLHNYHFFRVQTIDTFFQSVLRNLARELQLNANLRVELNNKQVVEQAIDNLIDSIADNIPLRSVVMGYIRERISNNESWNFIRGIKDFGGNIFKDFYKEHRKCLNTQTADPDFFKNYKEELYALKNNLAEKYIKKGNEAINEIDENGFSPSNFSYGKGGVINYFYKLADGLFFDIDMEKVRMKQGYEDPTSWVKKTEKERDVILNFVNSTLYPLMQQIEVNRCNDTRQYLSAQKTLEHINNVWLLKYVEDFARKLNDATQRFMLSDTPSLLSEMIKDDDSPFIFEKIGAHLEHIMIDEFQDTSTVQWQNFKKLLAECMSKGYSNLIVGDVKQSIYRWRSGDWRLLNGIDQQFGAGSVRFEPLGINYRSDANVVHFNNAFFKKVAALEAKLIEADSTTLAAQLRTAYNEVAQELPEGKPSSGFVHIDLMPKESETTMEERTLGFINELTTKGAPLKDIAILVRSNRDAVSLATYLETEGISVVSAEAFRLDASPAVRIIVGIMKMLAHPKDKITHRVLQNDLLSISPANVALLEDILSHQKEQLLMLSPHDMAEEIVRIFSLGNREGAYITTFFDKLHAFCLDTSTILEDFLEAWDSDICQKTIETPDCDGVRIMTIHKSKGLEFPHVIIPYCNWKLEQRQVIWCEPKEKPFSQLPIVPLNYTSPTAFKNTIYYNDVLEEHVQNMVDNLNLLYVALTRARTSLFVIGVRGEKNNTQRSFIIERAIRQLSEEKDEIDGLDLPLHISIPEDEDDDISLSYGTFGSFAGKSADEEKNSEPQEKSKNPFSPRVTPLSVDVTSFKSQAIFRQSNKSRTFADDALDESDRQRYIRKGTVLHQVFSQIATIDDVMPVLQRMEFDGTLYDEDMTKDDLLALLRSKFNNPQVKDWFSDKWQIYNECAILTPDGEQRPDRVMTDGTQTIVVDFKFGNPHPQYADQVRGYMSLLKQMGMPQVKGYLWFVSRDDIVEVTCNL